MKKRLIASLLIAAAALPLCGCGSVFQAEYVVETDYEPVIASEESSAGGDAVASLDELEGLLLDMVAEGSVMRMVPFDPAYEGDVSADLASACWSVRTGDALCAYCVENISYEVSRRANRYEAFITVFYSKTREERESVVPIPYAADAVELLLRTMREGCASLVLLIEHSSYTAEGMEDYVREIYRANPGVAPQEPAVRVSMTSGSEMQRLYEIELDYGLDAEELAARQAELNALPLFDSASSGELTEGERALLAFSGLLERCRPVDDAQESSIYDALVRGEAGSRGMALAYIEYCRALGLSCQFVQGAHNQETHCWTIVQIDGSYYHADPWAGARDGIAGAFLLNDEQAWESYRWDYFTYPHCTGTLQAGDILLPDLPEIEINP